MKSIRRLEPRRPLESGGGYIVSATIPGIARGPAANPASTEAAAAKWYGALLLQIEFLKKPRPCGRGLPVATGLRQQPARGAGFMVRELSNYQCD
jgi:hypothetical protein